MAKDPAFLFYSKDWLEGTAEYTPEEKGVLIDLMCYQHQKGSIPSDITRLARLVRLSMEEFNRVWSVVSEKWEANGDRLVNRKLTEVMTERSAKGHKNKIIGTFASLLRKAKLSAKEYKIIKSDFKVDDFIDSTSECITERLTEWLTERLKSIAIANAIGDTDSKAVYPFIIKDEFFEIFNTWIKHKTARKETYKTDNSLKGAYVKLLKLSNNDPLIAEEIITDAIANNYAGFFALKGSGTTKQADKFDKLNQAFHTPNPYEKNEIRFDQTY